jgi:rod shape determining protein RodA
MARYRSFRDFDWPLLIITLIICALGVLQIYSATHDYTTASHDYRGAWWKQILYIFIALCAMWLAASVDYHTLLAQTPILYTLSVLALMATFLLGKRVAGGRRWLFHLQISEFVKIVIILVVARYLSELKSDELSARDLFKLGGLVGIPTALVMAQPDFSTGATYVPILIVGILLAGIQWRHVAVIAIVCALTAPVWWFGIGQDYQKQRLLTFLDRSQDPQGRGYQVIQSKIAVGDGGMWGRGVTHGTQTQLRFLPVPHTDFIFASFAEEHGFVMVVVALGLYFLLLMQIVQDAQTAPDRAGVYICMGVATLLLFHVLVNVGMVVGNVPVSGIPLPLMSAGGSNMISVFMMLGLVNNVRLRRFVS